jgi:hypothetical protein
VPFFASLGNIPARARGALLPSTGYPFFQNISASVQNYNLRTQILASGWNGTTFVDATVLISANVVIGSTSTATSAFVSGALPTNSQITIINSGTIVGKGGFGANAPSGVGGNGGNALNLSANTTIINNNLIGSGGGGGGGGAQRLVSGSPYVGGSGGGGGAGSDVGTGGSGSSGSSGNGNSGANGTLTTGGAGGLSVGTDLFPTQSQTFDGTRTSNGGTPQSQTTYTWTAPTGGTINRIRVRMWGGGGGGAWWPSGICVGGSGAGGAQFDITDSTVWANGFYVECGNSGLSGAYGGSGGGGFPDSFRSGGAGGFSRLRQTTSESGAVIATVCGGNGGRGTYVANPNLSNSFDTSKITNLNHDTGGNQGNDGGGGSSTWGGGGGTCGGYSGGVASNGGGNGGAGNTDGGIPGGGGGSCDSCGPRGNGGHGRIIITVNP